MKILFILSALVLSIAAHAENFLGHVPIFTIYHPYSGSGSVPTTGWTQLVASLPSNVSLLQIYDTSGQVMKIAKGASGSEVAFPMTIPRGGNNGDGTPVSLTSGTRISIEAASTTASTGEIIINFFQ